MFCLAAYDTDWSDSTISSGGRHMVARRIVWIYGDGSVDVFDYDHEISMALDLIV